jgi:cell division initiation protein
MKITPLDIRQHSFKKSLNGYDVSQVNALLELIAAEWESLLRESQGQQDRLARQDELIREFQEKERVLRETLVSAQKMSNDMKQNAKKEADIIISQAELQADKIIHQAHGRLIQLIDDINDMKRQRAEFEGKLSGMLESHRRLLDLQKDVREEAQLEDVAVLKTTSSA